MASLYFCELNKLKNSQKQLERYQSTIIDQLSKIEKSEFQQLNHFFRNSRINCDDANCKLEIQDIIDKLKYVKRAVTVDCGKNILDFELFQEDLINVLNRVQDLKVQSRIKLEDLKKEQNELDEDIKLYTERLYLWAEPIKSDFNKNETCSKVDATNNDLPDDVKKFMNFVRMSNGHENGWAFNDHHLFLKLRKKYPDLNDLSLNLHEILPDISLEEVRRHEAWYTKYLNLKEKNNEAIKRWKKLKKDITTTGTDFVPQCEKLEESEEVPKKHIKPIRMETNERIKVREEINNWKKEREVAKKKQQIIKMKQIEESRVKEKEREKINELKKGVIRKWKEEKLSLEEEKIRSEEAKNYIEKHVRASVANKMIKYYQIRDRAVYNNIKHEEKNCMPERKLITCQVSRDPKRLFRPTQQWINRFMANNESDPIRSVNFIGRIPKLQVPS